MEPIKKHLMYENKDYGFRFKFPEAWTVVENPSCVVALLAPKNNIAELAKKDVVSISTDNLIDNTFDTNLNLTYQDLTSQPMNLNTFIENSLNQIESFLKEFGLVSAEDAQLSGKPAKKIVYTGNVQGKYNAQFQQYVTINNFKAHILTYTATRKYYPLYLDEVNDIISSFEIV